MATAASEPLLRKRARSQRSATQRIDGSSETSLLLELAVEQLFGKLHALEIEELCILFSVAIQRHADLPGLRKHRRILDGGFVIKVVRIDAGEALDYVQFVAAEIAGPVEPSQAVQARDIDHQSLTFPVAVIGSHPGIGAGLDRFSHVDEAVGAGVLVYKQDTLRRL